MGRSWKRWCIAGLVLAGLGCNDDKVTGVRRRPEGVNQNIDVSTGTLLLTLEYGSNTSFSTLGISPNWSCSWQLFMDPTPPSNPNGQFVSWICGNSSSEVSISALPPGAHTFQLRSAYQNGYLLGEAQATLVGGASTPLTMDLSQQATLVRGSLKVNDAAPQPYEYVVCAIGSECYFVSTVDGSFAYIDAPTTHTAAVHGSSAYATLGRVTYTGLAQQTVNVGEIAVQTGKLDLQLQYGGAGLGTLGVSQSGSCPFYLYVDPTPTNPGGEFARYVCGTDLTATSLITPQMPAGSHTFQLRTTSGVIVASSSTTITAASTTSQAFELSGVMGLITGNLTINGQGPAQDYQYVACSQTSDCYYAAKTTGAFSFLEVSGQRTLTMRASNATGGATVTATVAAGQTTALGAVSADVASATVDILFAGQSVRQQLSQSQYCFYLYRDPTANNPNGEYVRYLCSWELADPSFKLQGLPVGTHTIELHDGRTFARLGSSIVQFTTGQESAIVFDLTGTTGLVSGTLLVNGQAPSPSSYFICPASQGCYFVTDAHGTFVYFDFPGARTATVRGSSTNVDISEFGYSVSAGVTTIVGTTEGGAAGNTVIGTGIEVKPVDSNTGTQTVTLTFGTVTGGGQTTVSQNPHGPNPPKGQKGGSPTWYYYIATSATFTGTVKICINYDPTNYNSPSKLALQHYDESTGQWTNVTTSNDVNLSSTPPTGVICGVTTSFSPYLITEPDNAAPVANATASQTTVDEGTEVTFNGSGSNDPNGDALDYSWDFGDGTSKSNTAIAKHTYVDNANYTATLTVTEVNSGGLSSSATIFMGVRNVAPTADFTAPSSVVEGSTITLAAINPNDPSPADVAAGLKIEFDCGSGFGSSGACGVAVDGPATRVFQGRITDKDGGARTYPLSVTVTNADPGVQPLQSKSIVSGETFTLASSFTDAGAGDGPWTATIDWNDGSLPQAKPVAAQGSVSDSHRYTTLGTYVVSLTVKDKDGGQRSQTMTLTVAPLVVTIDAQPGKVPNSISLKKPPSTIPVLILSTATFDATTVDPATLTLGDERGTDTPVARSSTGTLVVNSPVDMNNDGRPDLMVHFSTSELQANGDLSTVASTTPQNLILRGRTKSPDSRHIRGTDQIAVTP